MKDRPVLGLDAWGRREARASRDGSWPFVERVGDRWVALLAPRRTTPYIPLDAGWREP